MKDREFDLKRTAKSCRNHCIVLFKCNFRDLGLVCGLNLKPFRSGESAVEVLILILLVAGRFRPQ